MNEHTPQSPQYPDVEVALVGEDGNAFAIIGAVRRAIAKTHGRDAADDFVNQATECGSYDQLLRFVSSTVAVS